MAFLGAAPFFTAWLFLIRYHFFFICILQSRPMAGFGAFLTHVFFSLLQEEEKNLKKNFSTQLFLILLVIIQIIYIYLLHAHYAPQDIFLQLISLLGDLKCS